MNNTTIAKRKVYHISPIRLWLVPGIFFAFAIGLFGMVIGGSESGTPETKELAIYMGIFFLAFGVVMYLILRYTRLVLSDEGIKLYQFGYKLETDWENVAYLYEGESSQGLVLHRPMDCRGAYALTKFRNSSYEGVNLYNDDQIRLLAEQRFIPVDAFSYWLERGGLRNDLINRAPNFKNGLKTT